MQKQGRSRDQTLISPPKTNAISRGTHAEVRGRTSHPTDARISNRLTSRHLKVERPVTPHRRRPTNHVRVLGLIWMCNVTIRIYPSLQHSTAGYLEVEDSDAAATQAWRGRMGMHRGHPEHPRSTLGVPVVWGGSGCISDVHVRAMILYSTRTCSTVETFFQNEVRLHTTKHTTFFSNNRQHRDINTQRTGISTYGSP